MHLSERQAHIAEMLHQADIIRVEDLSRHFQVTTQTIRRDLNFLCENGLARRVHGGIQRVHTPGNVAYAWRQVLNNEAKLMICPSASGRPLKLFPTPSWSIST